MSKRWGTPTWYFLHTIVEKMDNDHYEKIYPELNNIISEICNNLPCPYCKTDATKYIKKHDIHKIKTKDEMKNYLFRFHNVVNSKIRKKQANIKILDLYKRAIFRNITRLFFFEFFRSSPMSRTFNSWQKRPLEIKIAKFINANRKYIREL